MLRQKSGKAELRYRERNVSFAPKLGTDLSGEDFMYNIIGGKKMEKNV